MCHRINFRRHWFRWMSVFGLVPLLCGCITTSAERTLTPASAAPSAQATAFPAADRPRIFILGQDLGAIRGYLNSSCCVRPDGLTGYVDLYALLSKQLDFGGLGIDATGQPIDLESDSGGGPDSAYKTVTEFGIPGFAAGLSITENQHPGAMADLIAGRYDAEIHQLGVLLGKHRGTTYLRIGYEYDGPWNQGYEKPEQYRQAYRRIVDILRVQHVERVEFVWQASASSVGNLIDHHRKDPRDWYPGDEYVDWVAISWFMHPDATISVPSDYRPATPRQLADELIALAREHGKPVMIAEAAPQAYDLARRMRAHHVAMWDGEAHSGAHPVSDKQIWESWFQPLFEYLDEQSDVIRAFAYINCNWDAQAMWGPPYKNGFWGDTRLETNPAIAARFNTAIRRWQRRP